MVAGGASGNYSPQIAKQFVEGYGTNASAGKNMTKGNIKTQEEFDSLFKTKKPEKSLDWASDVNSR